MTDDGKYSDRVDYQIARDLATRKARVHGKSTWPFNQTSKDVMGVTAEKQDDGQIRTSVFKALWNPVKGKEI